MPNSKVRVTQLEVEVLDADVREQARVLAERLAQAELAHGDAAVEDARLEGAVERHDALAQLQARDAAFERALELRPAESAREQRDADRPDRRVEAHVHLVGPGMPHAQRVDREAAVEDRDASPARAGGNAGRWSRTAGRRGRARGPRDGRSSRRAATRTARRRSCRRARCATRRRTSCSGRRGPASETAAVALPIVTSSSSSVGARRQAAAAISTSPRIVPAPATSLKAAVDQEGLHVGRQRTRERRATRCGRVAVGSSVSPAKSSVAVPPARRTPA